MELGEELKEVITSGVLVIFLTTLMSCRILHLFFEFFLMLLRFAFSFGKSWLRIVCSQTQLVTSRVVSDFKLTKCVFLNYFGSLF